MWAYSLTLKRLIKYIIQIAVNLLLILIFLTPEKTAPSQYVPPKYQVLSFTSSKLEVKEAVIEYFGHEFAKIVECESGYNVRAVSKPNRNGTIDGGVFQINSSNLKEAKKLGYDLSTVQGQFEYAKFLIDRRGYKDWTCRKVLKTA